MFQSSLFLGSANPDPPNESYSHDSAFKSLFGKMSLSFWISKAKTKEKQENELEEQLT